jgi:DNA-directed RNA polymerase specialized sigma24 family protein
MAGRGFGEGDRALATPPERRDERKRDTLTTPDDVVRALTLFYGGGRRRERWLLAVNPKGSTGDAYGSGFLDRVEVYSQLGERLRMLSQRDRLLLFLWYAEGWPVTRIAERLAISRMQCYRIRDRALAQVARSPQTSA